MICTLASPSALRALIAGCVAWLAAGTASADLPDFTELVEDNAAGGLNLQRAAAPSAFPGGAFSPSPDWFPGGMWRIGPDAFPGGMWSPPPNSFPGAMWFQH